MTLPFGDTFLWLTQSVWKLPPETLPCPNTSFLNGGGGWGGPVDLPCLLSETVQALGVRETTFVCCASWNLWFGVCCWNEGSVLAVVRANGLQIQQKQFVRASKTSQTTLSVQPWDKNESNNKTSSINIRENKSSPWCTTTGTQRNRSTLR